MFSFSEYLHSPFPLRDQDPENYFLPLLSMNHNSNTGEILLHHSCAPVIQHRPILYCTLIALLYENSAVIPSVFLHNCEFHGCRLIFYNVDRL